MHRPPLGLLTALAILLAGPAAPAQHCAPDLAAPELPCVPRGSAEPDAAALPAVAPDSLPPAAPPHRYRRLRECDTQCLAARHSSAANLLDRERAELAAAHPGGEACGLQKFLPCHWDARAHRLRQLILYYSAMEARNRSAGSALELFFRLAEAEAQSDLLDLTRADLADAIRRGEELQAKGFRVPADLATLRRQLIDAEAEHTRLQAGLVELNGRLKGLTGLEDLPPDEWLWPAVEHPVSYEPVDVEAAVAVALANRPELLLLRALDQDLDAKTLPVVREYLHSLSGLLGSSGGPAKRLVSAVEALKAFLLGRGGEKALRSGQIRQLLAERERAVADEVRRAAALLHTKSRLAALSRERVLNQQAQVREAEDKAGRGAGSFLEVMSTRVEWYKARGQLTTDVMGWHTARAQLRMAQGLLAWECCGPGK